MVLRVCHVTTGSDHSTSHQLDICLQERDEVIFVRVLKTKHVVLLSLMGMKLLSLSLRNQSVSDYTWGRCEWAWSAVIGNTIWTQTGRGLKWIPVERRRPKKLFQKADGKQAVSQIWAEHTQCVTTDTKRQEINVSRFTSRTMNDSHQQYSKDAELWCHFKPDWRISTKIKNFGWKIVALVQKSLKTLEGQMS